VPETADGKKEKAIEEEKKEEKRETQIHIHTLLTEKEQLPPLTRKTQKIRKRGKGIRNKIPSTKM